MIINPNDKCVKNNVEVGDLLIFLNDGGNISNVYIICYDESKNKFYVQNIDGSKSRLRYYNSIDALMAYRKAGGYKVIKSNKAKISFNIEDGFEY